jgi:hypothetical protein
MKRSLNPLPLLSNGYRFLRGVLKLLRRIPGYWYAITFFLLIIVFAYIYSRLPGEFYHSNVSREPMIREDEKRIGSALQKEIISAFENIHGGRQTLVDNWIIDASTFNVLFLKATDKGTDAEIRFKLAMELTNTSPEHGSLLIDSVVTFSAKEWSESVTGGDLGNESKIFKTVKVDVPTVPYWDKQRNSHLARIFFPTQRAGVSQNEGNANPEDSLASLPEVMMPISKRLNDDILNLGKGVQGDPSNLSGHFERMLYLSALTITTAGYGDITPLTTRARLLIILEAVLGIILFGLFLSTLSGQKSGNNSTGSTP